VLKRGTKLTSRASVRLDGLVSNFYSNFRIINSLLRGMIELRMKGKPYRGRKRLLSDLSSSATTVFGSEKSSRKLRRIESYRLKGNSINDKPAT